MRIQLYPREFAQVSTYSIEITLSDHFGQTVYTITVSSEKEEETVEEPQMAPQVQVDYEEERLQMGFPTKNTDIYSEDADELVIFLSEINNDWTLKLGYSHFLYVPEEMQLPKMLESLRDAIKISFEQKSDPVLYNPG